MLFVECKDPPPPPVARSQDRGVGAAEGVIGVVEVGGGGEADGGGGESRLGEGVCEVGGLCGDEEIGAEVEAEVVEVVTEEEDMEADGSGEGGGVPGRVSSVATTVLPVCTVPRPSIVTPPTPWSCASKEARILSKDGAVEAAPVAVVAPVKASSDEAAAVASEVFVPEAAAELPFIVGSPALCAESTTVAGTLPLADPVALLAFGRGAASEVPAASTSGGSRVIIAVVAVKCMVISMHHAPRAHRIGNTPRPLTCWQTGSRLSRMHHAVLLPAAQPL